MRLKDIVIEHATLLERESPMLGGKWTLLTAMTTTTMTTTTATTTATTTNAKDRRTAGDNARIEGNCDNNIQHWNGGNSSKSNTPFVAKRELVV